MRNEIDVLSIISRWRGVWEPAGTLAVAALAILYAVPVDFRRDIVVLGAVYGLLAIGMYLPFVMGDGLSLAYNAYLGIGAFSVALIGENTAFSVLWGLPVGALLSAVVALLLGLATARLSGFYLAGVTLLFGTAFAAFLRHATSITGGAAGITGLPRPTFFGWELDRMAITVLAVLIAWLAGFAVSRMRRAPYGVVLRIQGEVPAAIEASGIRAPLIKLLSLMVGAGIASLGGAMLAMMNRFVVPDTFGLHIVFLAVFMPLLGGRRTPWGAVLGAVIVSALTFNVTFFQDGGTLVFAVAVLLVLRFAPDGVLGIVTGVTRRVTKRVKGSPA